ncbi:NAD(P)-dependent oxidoreductase [Streptomyces sp. GSL17-111]|uniref:NAD(P)-dependent oxidoreductase n=1 Tax=Streptomyces sp. GSL17-111 TaxID=3121596 RepID=UPI0030F40D16
MRITVFGAAGGVGSRVVAEAVSRGHDVTAVVRDTTRFPSLHPGAIHRTGDAARPEDVAALAADQDVVITATRPAPGQEHELPRTTAALMSALAEVPGPSGTGVRLLVVGGAGGLTVPGTGGTVLDQPDFPPFLVPIARACNEQLAVCRAETRVDWTYLSPASLLEPGERTGRYRLGTDELLIDADGHSRISMEDLAVALLDEAENPRHRRVRFTAAY